MTKILKPRNSVRAVKRTDERSILAVSRGGDKLELEVRHYRAAGVFLVVEPQDQSSLGAVALIEEIVVELHNRFANLPDGSRLIFLQPTNAYTTRPRYLEWVRAGRSIDGWRLLTRADAVRMTRDRGLPAQ